MAAVTSSRSRGDKDHPASQGYTCNKALRLDLYQNNPTRHLSRCGVVPTAATKRKSTGIPPFRSRRGFTPHRRRPRRGQDLLLRGGGQATTSGAYSGCRVQSPRIALPLQRAGAGRPATWVDAHLYGGPHPRRVRTRRGVGVRRQEPLDVAELGSGLFSTTRQRSGALDDRDRPGAHRHRQARRLPPGVKPGADVVPGGTGRRSGRKTSVTKSFLAEHVHGVEDVRVLAIFPGRRPPRSAG